jgi:hypothetical protein
MSSGRAASSSALQQEFHRQASRAAHNCHLKTTSSYQANVIDSRRTAETRQMLPFFCTFSLSLLIFS